MRGAAALTFGITYVIMQDMVGGHCFLGFPSPFCSFFRLLEGWFSLAAVRCAGAFGR